MENVIFKVTIWLRRKSFFRVAERTMTMVMPLAIIGSIFKFLWQSVFSPDSMISNILYFDKWLPDSLFNAAWYATQGLSSVIFETFGLFVAYFAAQHTARLYHKDAQMAGLSGMLTLMLCAYRFRDPNNLNVQMSFNWRFLGIQSFLYALMMGYVVGQIFHFLGVEFHHHHFENAKRIEKRAFASFKPMFVTLLLGLIVGIITSLIQVRVVATAIYQYFQNEGQNNLNIWSFIPLIFLALLLNWLGIGQPLVALTSSSASGTNVANLNYALEHGSSWNVPNKFVGNALYQSYGKFGGSGLTLTLLIAILLVYKHQNTVKVARWSFIPTLFGSNQGALFGLPIVWNPLFLIPYVLMPIFNILIASTAIAIGMIPASAYLVLSGTPGPLVSFIATNGNWLALIFALILFAIDIVVYIPIVKMAGKIQDKIDELNDKEAGYDYVQ